MGEQRATSMSAARRGAAAEAANAGRLIGWLVSYRGSPEGAAIEVREGKFFVTARGLKSTDLVLDDPSVSTPHALVTADASGAVKVQDLMSEMGIFVRTRERDEYEQCPEHAEIRHGDWLRFGEVEFLVSLIPYVGSK